MKASLDTKQRTYSWARKLGSSSSGPARAPQEISPSLSGTGYSEAHLDPSQVAPAEAGRLPSDQKPGGIPLTMLLFPPQNVCPQLLHTLISVQSDVLV